MKGRLGQERVLLATEAPVLVEEIRTLVAETLGEAAPLEVTSPDGALVLSRLTAQPPCLAFLPTDLRGLETRTVLRALGPEAAARVVLLAPATQEGYRAALDGVSLGARDFFSLRPRSLGLGGDRVERIRQLAALLFAIPESASTPFALELDERHTEFASAPHVLLPETRDLRSLLEAVAVPVGPYAIVIRIPESPGLLRVVHEELHRTSHWPVRSLQNLDRIAAGQIHLFSPPSTLALEGREGRVVARLSRLVKRRGQVDPRRELLRRMGSSPLALIVLSGRSLDPDERRLLRGPAPRLIQDLGRIEATPAQSGDRRAA